MKSGSVGAFRNDDNGNAQLVGVVAAGGAVGEVGMIVDMPRNASVRALRDSELLRLSREDFDKLVNHHPRAMLAMARLAVRRLSSRDEDATMTAPRKPTAVGNGRSRTAVPSGRSGSLMPPAPRPRRRETHGERHG